MKKILTILFAGFAALTLSACSTMSNNEATPERYSDLHFDNKQPIPLMVNKIDVKSEFSPSFTRPNVEHLFPVSIEKTAKIWAKERLEAADYSSGRVAEVIIEDASVTEHEQKSEQILQKDLLQYHANLKVTVRVLDSKASAQTTVEAYRDLTMSIDTNIEDKEKHWNEMVIRLFQAFDERMETDIRRYLNMYIKDDKSITTF